MIKIGPCKLSTYETAEIVRPNRKAEKRTVKQLIEEVRKKTVKLESTMQNFGCLTNNEQNLLSRALGFVG